MTKAVGDIFYGAYVADYEEKRSRSDVWEKENASLVTLLDLVNGASRVLDVPFGSGRFLEEYLRRGFSVTGVDISGDMFEQAKRLRGGLLDRCETFVGSADNLPYDDDSFDLVVSYRFLSGIVDSGTALASMREFHRVAPKAILQLKCRNPKLEPIDLPKPNEKLGVAYYRKDMDTLFAGVGYRIDAEVQIDDDPKGIRWAFLVSRL